MQPLSGIGVSHGPRRPRLAVRVTGVKDASEAGRGLYRRGQRAYRSGTPREGPVMLPCVRCATLDGYAELARSFGLDPGRLMTQVGLEATDLALPDKWIPAAAVARLLDLSAREAGRDDFGLCMAAFRRLSTLGPLSVVLREEPDLRRALRLLVRYEHSYNEALHLRLSEANGLATLTLWFEFAEPAPTRQALDLAVATVLGIIRAVVRDTWEPLAISFSHGPPARTDTLLRLLGPRVQFEQQFTGLVFYASELDAK